MYYVWYIFCILEVFLSIRDVERKQASMMRKTFLTLPLKVQGVIWKTMACACFAMMNIIVRYLTGGSGGVEKALSSSQIAFLQYLIGAIFFLPVLVKKETFEALKTGRKTLHLMRVVFAASGVICLYYAFKSMPAAKAVALGFTSPILTVIGAAFYLRERIGPFRLIGILFGFTGAFLITRPDQAFMGDSYDPLGWIIALPLLASACFAASKVLGRKLASNGEAPKVLTTYILIFMAPIMLIPALVDWRPLEWEHFLYLIPLGIVATLGNLTHAYCYKCAEISFLAPFGFSRLLFTAFFAYSAFGELPRSEALWIGAVIIFAGTVIICFQEDEGRKKIKARAAPLSAG